MKENEAEMWPEKDVGILEDLKNNNTKLWIWEMSCESVGVPP